MGPQCTDAATPLLPSSSSDEDRVTKDDAAARAQGPGSGPSSRYFADTSSVSVRDDLVCPSFSAGGAATVCCKLYVYVCLRAAVLYHLC